MNTAPIERIHAFIADLEAHGIQLGELPSIEIELEALDHPPGFFTRLTGHVREFANEQWRHLIAELTQSRELTDLISRQVRGDEPLTPAEEDEVQEQVSDLFRLVPASLIFLAVEAFPVPGSGLLTPWILAKLGLLPSSWREAHVLARLRKEASRLRDSGHTIEADDIDAIASAIEQTAIDRTEAAHTASLLTHWDHDKDGVWDEDERSTYDSALQTLQARLPEIYAEKRWYINYHHHVFGPVRLCDLTPIDLDEPILVSYEGKSGWIALGDIVDVV